MCIQQFEDKPLESKIQDCFEINQTDEEFTNDYSINRFYSSLGRNVCLNAASESLCLNKTWSLEDIFTIVYVFVDDAYDKLFGSQSYFRLSSNNKPVFTDSEVITLALVCELSGFESRNSWWNYVSKNYRQLFPKLCDRTRYCRRLKRLKNGIEQIRRHLSFLMNADLSGLRVVDSFPVSVCHLQRVKSSSCPFEYYASFGYCAAKKENFYGFKVHLVTDTRGIIVGYMLSSGHVHDTKGLIFLLEENLKTESVLEQIIAMFGDKGYVGQDYALMLQEQYSVKMLAMRKYEKEGFQSAHNEIVGKGRKIIETTISVLTGTFNAGKTKARTIGGFLLNLVTKITALNLGNYLNILTGEPVLQVSSIVN